MIHSIRDPRSAPARDVARDGRGRALPQECAIRPLRTLVLMPEASPERRHLLRELGSLPGVEVVGEPVTGLEALSGLRTSAVDLLLLSARLPDLEGGDVVGIARRHARIDVVLASDRKEDAVLAFDLGAIGFLSLPASAEALRRTVERAREATARRRERADGGPDPREPGASWVRRLVARVGRRWVVVPIDSIVRLDSRRNYVCIRTAGGTVRARATLGELEKKLDPAQFQRVHRSTIVRLDRVREVETTIHGDCTVRLDDGSTSTATRTRRDGFLEALQGLGTVLPS